MSVITRERIIREEYEHLGLIIRWWIPDNGEEDKYFFDMLSDMNNYLLKLYCFKPEARINVIAQYMCDNFKINAVEVTHSRTGYGVVNYVDWP